MRHGGARSLRMGGDLGDDGGRHFSVDAMIEGDRQLD